MHTARVALPNMEPQLKIMAKVFYIKTEEDYLAEAKHRETQQKCLKEVELWKYPGSGKLFLDWFS